MRKKSIVLSLASGIGWGTLAWSLGRLAFPLTIWAGVAMSPLIGLLSGWVYHWAGCRSWSRQAAMSLVTLSLAITLFGVAVGVGDAVRPLPELGSSTRNAWAVICQAVLGVWWGMTATGWLFLLWPASFANHRLVGRWTKGLSVRES